MRFSLAANSLKNMTYKEYLKKQEARDKIEFELLKAKREMHEIWGNLEGQNAQRESAKRINGIMEWIKYGK